MFRLFRVSALAALVLLSARPAVAQFTRNDTDSTKAGDSDAFGKKNELLHRLYSGGDVSATFGTENMVMLAPVLGVDIIGNLSAGVGVRYIWWNSRTWNYNAHMFGMSVFTKYILADVILLHAEYEKLNVENYSAFEQRYRRTWIDVALVGGGYRQMLGERSYWNLLVLYDVINDQRSPYSVAYNLPLVFRTGFIIYLTSGK
jgi:hypothetical protein